ncbi:hypothetical protein KCU95_g19331, partial [Aureobasidium melanogenum]
MKPSNSKPMPSGGGNVAAAFRAIPSGKGRHYRDYDFVPARSGSLDYTESGLASPHNRTKRRRHCDLDQGRLQSFKKSRTFKDNRSNRLCLQCGNYHSSPCYVPYCSGCDLNHYPIIPCLDAMEQLKERLELHAPSEIVLSSKQTNKKNSTAPASLPLRFRDENHASPVLSDLQTPKSLLKSASQSPINRQQKGSPNKRSCPVCRECGSSHRSACKWPVCEQCHKKHHPETPCAIAEARLERRLEEEDARQAQVMEDIKKQENSAIDMNNETSSATLEATALSPGRALTPAVATRKLKKNTRFCRDCGRYLNRPCTWPTCVKCNTKHFEHVPCWQARQNLQNRLDTFDRGYSTSQKKTAKVTALPPTTEPSSQQIEHATKPNTADLAAPVDLAAPSEMIFNFDENGEMSWSIDSNKTIHFGPPPTNSHPPVSTASKLPKHHSHVHLSRQYFFSKPAETAGSIRESLTEITPCGSTLPSDSRRNEAPHLVTYGASLEENVDAFIAGVLRDMHNNNNVSDAPGHADIPHDVLSYLNYLRHNGT